MTTMEPMTILLVLSAVVLLVGATILAEPLIESERRNMLTKRDRVLPKETRGQERLVRNNPHLRHLVYR